MSPSPPPLPPRRARVPIPGPEVFGGDELPTERQGASYIERLLVKYHREMAPEDRVTLLRNAEQWAARNRK